MLKFPCGWLKVYTRFESRAGQEAAAAADPELAEVRPLAGNVAVAGSGGGIDVTGGPMRGLPDSCDMVIPANGVVVFARDLGD